MKKSFARTLAAITVGSMILNTGMTVLAEDEKTDIVLLIECADEPFSEELIERLTEHFPQYNFVSKLWGDADNTTIVKSTFATDSEAIDIAMFNNSMSTYVQSDMALDLTPYLEEDKEFKDRFLDSALNGAANNIDGKVYALPYSTVYPMLEVNLDILEQAGVEFKEAWTWDEFIEVCEQITENTDAYPITCANNWAPWFGIQAMIQAIDDEDEYKDFCLGNVPFDDERILANVDKVAELYEKGYAYPGEGAITITSEEADNAFATGKVAIRCDVNSMAKNYVETCGIDPDRIGIGSWPTMANGGVASVSDRLLGGNNMYFIPSNSKHVDEAIEILKYIFSEEMQTMYADYGVVTCVKLDGAEDIAEYSKDASKMASDLIYSHSAELLTYINNEWLPEYLYDKESAIETFEEYREEMSE